MPGSPNPFPPGATRMTRLPKSRAPALVVFQNSGVTLLDHPVAGTRRSTLMVQDGQADLGRTKLKLLAFRLLALSDVALPEGVTRTSGAWAVPLLRPDGPVSPAITTWTITPWLFIDQIGADRAYLNLKGRGSQDVVTTDLVDHQWATLVRALVSLDVWMQHLRSELDGHSDDVRRRSLTFPRRQICILHRVDDGMEKVFAYEESDTLGDKDLLETAFFMFNEGEGTHTAAYRSQGLRSLSVGDAVVIDDRTYLCEPDGWSALTTSVLIAKTPFV